jgi:hypothetical protein
LNLAARCGTTEKEMDWRPVRGYKAKGKYPSTEWQLRHIHRNKSHNGYADAFTRVGNRVLFSPDRFDEIAARRSSDR